MLKQLRQIRFHRPDVATKTLKVQTVQEKRRVTVSSNLLLLMGFEGNVTQVVEQSLGSGQGFTIRPANQSEIEANRAKKVYLREYSSRSANPLKRTEHLVQVTRKDLINDALGHDCEHVHVTMSFGLITIKPIDKAKYELLQDFDTEEQINTLVAMTGGVDCHVLEKSGFKISAVIEYRPQEKRDSADYTELTSLSVLANSKPDVLFNEDIYQLNIQRMGEILAKSPITVAHFSLQCDDFSTLKTHKQRESSVDELSSTLDMFIPMLNILDELKSPVLVVENVPGFATSPINNVLRLQLMRRGYSVHQDVFDARDYGGHTSRQRMYMVATALNAPFVFPEKTAVAPAVWDGIIEPNWNEIVLKDVTDTKVMQEAIKSGRARVIHQHKHHAPTLTKAQGQDTKDAVVVEKDGRFYRLPIAVQKRLNCIADTFDADWMPVDKAAQIIGQSICCNLHESIMISVKSHILASKTQAKKFISAAKAIATPAKSASTPVNRALLQQAWHSMM
jgi:DNA (cytosine-5)-methyltransferase 1